MGVVAGGIAHHDKQHFFPAFRGLSRNLSHYFLADFGGITDFIHDDGLWIFFDNRFFHHFHIEFGHRGLVGKSYFGTIDYQIIDISG